MKAAYLPVLFLVSLPLALAQDTTTKEEGPLLAGTWKIESIVAAGGFKIDGMGWTMTFAEGKLTMKMQGETMTAAYKITPGKPSAIDITPSDGDEKDKTSKCILELTGDQLKICVAKPDADRPKEFKAGGKISIINLKRDKQ